MLTKRANILFEEKTWKELTARARKQNTSVGDLVRTAVERDSSVDELERRRLAAESLLRHRPKPFKGKIDYKALINEGR
ncbi:MAG: hypothetical protein Q7S79_01585, partial [bacterium]|nr:hypothetical protein [bacterium]